MHHGSLSSLEWDLWSGLRLPMLVQVLGSFSKSVPTLSRSLPARTERMSALKPSQSHLNLLPQRKKQLYLTLVFPLPGLLNYLLPGANWTTVPPSQLHNMMSKSSPCHPAVLPHLTQCRAVSGPCFSQISNPGLITHAVPCRCTQKAAGCSGLVPSHLHTLFFT